MGHWVVLQYNFAEIWAVPLKGIARFADGTDLQTDEEIVLSSSVFRKPCIYRR